ncbi:Interleukin-12 Receptor Subunit Beta-1 [Manis pentadactyla]|nr:Interleukin-12 Receptor Subunit Beta-1 [Manis pentadactyla]
MASMDPTDLLLFPVFLTFMQNVCRTRGGGEAQQLGIPHQMEMANNAENMMEVTLGLLRVKPSLIPPHYALCKPEGMTSLPVPGQGERSVVSSVDSHAPACPDAQRFGRAFLDTIAKAEDTNWKKAIP